MQTRALLWPVRHETLWRLKSRKFKESDNELMGPSSHMNANKTSHFSLKNLHLAYSSVLTLLNAKCIDNNRLAKVEVSSRTDDRDNWSVGCAVLRDDVGGSMLEARGSKGVAVNLLFRPCGNFPTH